LIVQNLSTAIVGIVIAMVANWKLACIVVCFVPCVFAQSYAQARFMRGFSADAKVYHLIVLFTSFISLCSLFYETCDVACRKSMKKQAPLLVMPSVISELSLRSV
jgi:hypothetical protein